jgi:hypothetical protein
MDTTTYSGHIFWMLSTMGSGCGLWMWIAFSALLVMILEPSADFWFASIRRECWRLRCIAAYAIRVVHHRWVFTSRCCRYEVAKFFVKVLIFLNECGVIQGVRVDFFHSVLKIIIPWSPKSKPNFIPQPIAVTVSETSITTYSGENGRRNLIAHDQKFIESLYLKSRQSMVVSNREGAHASVL